MIGTSLYLQQFFKSSTVIGWIILEFYHIFISVKFKRINFIQLSIGIQSMILQSSLIQLLYLGIQSIILKFSVSRTICGIFYIQVDELCSQTDQLWNALQQVIGKLVSKPHSFCHMLVQINGSLSAPGSFIFLQLNLIVFLGIAA